MYVSIGLFLTVSFVCCAQRKIQEANHVIQDTGLELMKSAEELHHARVVQKNIVSAMETLNRCIPGV